VLANSPLMFILSGLSGIKTLHRLHPVCWLEYAACEITYGTFCLVFHAELLIVRLPVVRRVCCKLILERLPQNVIRIVGVSTSIDIFLLIRRQGGILVLKLAVVSLQIFNGLIVLTSDTEAT
jgi:hypothetical protein